jgi:hypothetical protein
MNFYRCHACNYQMPEQNTRAIAAHQQEHPTEAQRKERHDRATLANVADAMATGRQLGVLERMAALQTILTADPGVMADEIFFKPLRKELAE